MGVHYLIRNLERVDGRLPFKITLNDKGNSYFESDMNIDKYKDIGNGNLQYIGIDGSVIIHSKIITDKNKILEKESAVAIVDTIMRYIKTVIIFFDIFNTRENINNSKKIILHFVIDGKAPCLKNRRKIIDDDGNETYKKDSYSLMSSKEKHDFHKIIIKYLKKELSFFFNNNDDYDNNAYYRLFKNIKIELLTNYNINEDKRGEGEIELFKFCQLLNKKNLQEKQSVPYKNVIISSDSDVISLMLMHKDKNLVVISPLNIIYITNFNLITKSLNLTAKNAYFKYVLLHFIFFGSDYNLGLMSNPNNDKQKAILNAIYDNVNNIDEIGQTFKRRRRKRKYNEDSYDDDEFLKNLKNLLIYEAICAFMYYYDIETGSKYLTTYSPRLYEKTDTKKYISFLNF